MKFVYIMRCPNFTDDKATFIYRYRYTYLNRDDR